MNRERAAKKLRNISVLGIKNHRSAAVRGGARRVRPPPRSASEIFMHIAYKKHFIEIVLLTN